MALKVEKFLNKSIGDATKIAKFQNMKIRVICKDGVYLSVEDTWDDSRINVVIKNDKIIEIEGVG